MRYLQCTKTVLGSIEVVLLNRHDYSIRPELLSTYTLRKLKVRKVNYLEYKFSQKFKSRLADAKSKALFMTVFRQ